MFTFLSYFPCIILFSFNYAHQTQLEYYEKIEVLAAQLLEKLSIQKIVSIPFNSSSFTEIQSLYSHSNFVCESPRNISDLYRDIPVTPYFRKKIEEPLKLTPYEEQFFNATNALLLLSKNQSEVISGKCCDSRNSRPNHDRNVILSLAKGYSCEKISQFLRSLRSTNITADVYIYRGSRKCNPALFKGCGRFQFLDILRFPRVKPEIRRYIFAYEWLTQHVRLLNPCAQVMIIDFKDVLFQQNPFIYLGRTGVDVVLGDEGNKHNKYRVTIEFEKVRNMKWIKTVAIQIFNDYQIAQKFLNYIKAMPVINSGIIIGNVFGMLHFLHVFTSLSLSLNLMDPFISGQGIVQFAYYYGLHENLRIKILPAAFNFFVHMDSYVPPLRSPLAPFHPLTNPFINAMGEPYAIIHQIDRAHVAVLVEPYLSKEYLNESCVPVTH